MNPLGNRSSWLVRCHKAQTLPTICWLDRQTVNVKIKAKDVPCITSDLLCYFHRMLWNIVTDVT